MTQIRLESKHAAVVGLMAVFLLFPGFASATSGYFAHGYGIKSKALAGAGVALPLDAMDAAVNPANMVMVGQQFDIGMTFFSPRREYTVSGAPTGFPGTFGLFPGNVESDNELFPIPNVAANWMLNNDSSFGISVAGIGGMNTEYKASDVDPFGLGTFGAGKAGVDLAQLFVGVTYARKFSERAAWGITPVLLYQRFSADGISSFAQVSNDPGNLSNRGTDDAFGFGLKLGVMGEVAPGLTLGASYQSEMASEEFDDYRGLFAEKGDFDTPATATLGLAWEIRDGSTLLFDVQRIWYSDVAAISNPILPNFGICATRTTATDPSCLGGSNGIGFGWDDITIYKLAYQWKTNGGWTWRAGVAVGDQPIPESEVLFNILAPAVVEEHITFGFTKEINKTSAVDVAFMYAPSNSVKGNNPLEAPGAQQIELEMSQFELAVQWTKTF